jgi:hypothetical protein
MYIWKSSLDGCYYVTTRENYNSGLQNARAIHKMEGFNSPKEIVAYFVKYCNAKPENFQYIQNS